MLLAAGTYISNDSRQKYHTERKEARHEITQTERGNEKRSRNITETRRKKDIMTVGEQIEERQREK